MALSKSSCLITFFSFSSTALEQAEAGALESRGWPWRDPDGIHKIFEKHHQLSVWEQRPGGDVNYHLTSLHVDSSTSERGQLLSLQIWNLTWPLTLSSPCGSVRNVPHLPEGTGHPRSWIIPSVLCLNLTLCFPRSNALVFTIPVFVVTL